MEINKLVLIIGACVGIAFSLAIGFIIGHFTVDSISASQKELVAYYRSIVEEPDASFGLEELLKNVDPQVLKRNL